MARWLVAMLCLVALVLPAGWVEQALYVAPDGSISFESCCVDAHGKPTEDHCCTVVSPSADRHAAAIVEHAPEFALVAQVASPACAAVDVPRRRTPAVRGPRGPPPDDLPRWRKNRALLL